MEPPAEVPIVLVYAGDDATIGTYTFLENGDPVDLSAWTLRASWRRTLESATAETLDVDDILAATGTITVTAPAAITRDMDGNGYWDLEGELGGQIRTFVYGRTKYREDVTRV
jgi:hypothetical protein